MKVYVVEIDNGMLYEEGEHYVEGTYKTFRGATQHLLDNGFIPYPTKK